MNPRYVLPIVLLLACAATAAADEPPKDQAYEIKIARPMKVGQKYSMTADGALMRQVTLRTGKTEQKQPEQGFGIHLQGTVEVLALDSIGEEAKVACTIEKCTRISPEGETELVPKGKVLIAEGKGKDTKFSLQDGGEVPKDTAEALELVISLDTNDTLDDDALFGTKDKKKSGESWPVSADAIAKDSDRVGVVVKPEDVEGSFRLDGIEKAGEVECLKLSGNLKIKKLLHKADDIEDDGLPEGFVVEGGSMEAKYSGLFPVDASAGSLAESASINSVTQIKGKGGPGDGEVKIESRMQRATEMKRRFLDK